MENTLYIIAAGCCIGCLIFGLLLKPKATDKKTVHNPVIFGIINITSVFVLAVSIVYFAAKDAHPAIIALFVALLFVGTGLSVLSFAFRIEYDEFSFTVRDHTFKKQEYSYRDIDSINSTADSNTLTIGDKKIHLNSYLVGREEFLGYINPRRYSKTEEITATAEKEIYKLAHKPTSTISIHLLFFVIITVMVVLMWLISIIPAFFATPQYNTVQITDIRYSDTSDKRKMRVYLYFTDENGTDYCVLDYPETIKNYFAFASLNGSDKTVETGFVKQYDWIIPTNLVTDMKTEDGVILVSRKDVTKRLIVPIWVFIVLLHLAFAISFFGLVRVLYASRYPHRFTPQQIMNIFHLEVNRHVYYTQRRR